mgnify:CR=1 FL=1
MKKLSKLLLMAVVALGVGFTACNNDDINTPQETQEGNTHVSVALNLSGSGLRSLPTDYNDVGEWAGNDTIKTITVYVSDLSEVARYDYTVGITASDAYKRDGSILRPTTAAAIKTTSGLKKVFVLVNATDQALTELGIAANGKGTAGGFETKYAGILALANSGIATPVQTSASKIAATTTDFKDEIMMTTIEPQNIMVAPNVTADETIVATGAKNRVSIKVERAVARVMITKSAATYNVPSADGSTSIGSLTDIHWVAAQGENSLYVQRKSTWETPNYGWKPASDVAYQSQAGGKYDYSGLYEGQEVTANKIKGTEIPSLAAYVALNAAKDNKAAVLASLGLDANAVNGKFVLPTTHEVNAGEASGFKKGNTAYVLVRAQFTPTTFADGGTYTAGSDFFVGANGLFYTTSDNAVTPATNGVTGQTVAKYVGGKVLYYAWLNPDEIPNWYNSPVLRNNIYHIHITGFRTLGVNWNPLYPEDPNTPTPNNPDPKPNVPGVTEPENPIDPEEPLTTPETWMSVDVTVLPWLVHSYDVNLGI